MRHTLQRVMNGKWQDGRARLRELKGRLMLQRAEELKKDAAGDISSLEELDEVKRRIEKMEGKFKALEKVETKIREETWSEEQ